MENIFDFDLKTIDSMYLPYFSHSQWSNDLLDYSMRLIDTIRTERTERTEIEFITQHNTLLPSLHTDIIFKQYQTQLNRIINMDDFQLLKKITVHTLDEFQYLITHVPFQRQLIDTLYQEMVLPPIEIYQYLVGSFISPVILSWILAQGLIWSSYHLKVNSDFTVKIDILHQSLKEHDLLKIVKQICHIIDMMCCTYQVKTQTVHIIYAMTPFKKQIDYFKPNRRINQLLKKNLSSRKSLHYNYHSITNPLTSLHVNTGVTVFQKGKKYITIWRTEEFPKVLIHELIHFFNLEKCHILKPINLNVSNNYPHYPKELLTELQTWYMFIIYNMSLQRFEYTKDDLRFILDYERTYSLLNLVKIAQHSHLSKCSHLLTIDPTHMINVNSSTLYYYVLKAIMLYEIDKCLEQILLPNHSYQKQKCQTFPQNRLQHIISSTPFCQYFKNIVKKKLSDDSLRMMSLCSP
jgi:hypothetical protein